LSELNNLKLEIKNIFFNVFPNLKDEDFDWEKHQSGYEDWDSFAHLQLVSKIEKQFNIRFDIDQIMNVNSPNDFLKFVNHQ